MNINRDYLIINDVKKSNITLDNGSMFFYITDKNTQNIFVNLVINISNNDLIQKYANIENAEDYTLTMNIVKPSNTYKVIEGKLHDKENAIFEFDLKEDCCDEIGTYKCELLTKCNINNHEEITTSNKLTYKVKSSVLNDLDDIVEAPEYPLVIQLFDKLSDIEQYEEDRRANELARQLAEKQRQTRFDTLDADMTDRITAMDDKMVDVENRVSTKEQAVDKLINDTKANIDGYKVAKDQEIDEYKTAKDTEINNAITAQDNKIDEAISNQNDRITLVENNVVAQNNRLDIIENKNTQQDNRLDIVEAKNAEQDNRLNAIEAIDVSQNTRLNAIEVKNQQQDDRLLDIEKVNKRQDMNLKCLFAESKNNMIDVTEEGNSIYLQNSTIGYTLIDEIKGNTLVNCNKEPDKELILNGNINTSGDNTVTITEGVDNGKVDVMCEGNTLVNLWGNKTEDFTLGGQTIFSNSKISYSSGDTPTRWNDFFTKNLNRLKANTEYTVITNVIKNELTEGTVFINNPNGDTGGAFDSSNGIKIQGGKTGVFINKITSRANFSSLTDTVTGLRSYFDNTNLQANISVELQIIMLEGDYTSIDSVEYFEGMKSVGQDDTNGHKIEILSTDLKVDLNTVKKGISISYNSGTHPNGTEFEMVGKESINNIYVKENTKITIEGVKPLRIHFYDINKIWLSQQNENVQSFTIPSNCRYIGFAWDSAKYNYNDLKVTSSNLNKKEILLNEPLRGLPNGVKDRFVKIGGKWFIERNCGTRTYEEGDKDVYITDLVNTVYPLETPTYDEIDYNPLEVYSGTTYITTNSTIPTNITVKNHGFNCLLKPSTTYTISSNLGLNTVTTPSTLTEDCLRFMDTDTSDVTTMKNVLVLEGDWTTKADLIPANFSGIESAFEQEYDAEKGKYKVNVKVANEDKSKENNITFYINEPLRGVSDAKDRIFIKDDKVVVERNIGAKRLTSEDVIGYGHTNTGPNTKPNVKIIGFRIPNLKPSWGGLTTLCNKLKTGKIGRGNLTAIEHIYWGTEYNWIGCNNTDNPQVAMTVDKTLLLSDDIEGARQYIDNEDIELVYQLAEPTYEEVEYNDTKLFIESFKNSTLSYNSNVPVTSKLYYSYSVPIVDTVAQTADVTDQQDSMIIDLATQVAVMEMMLM